MDRAELPAEIYVYAFCLPHVISESPADEEEQWSDDFVSIAPEMRRVLFPPELF